MLSLVTFVPAVAALLLAVLPSPRDEVVRGFTLAVTLLVFVATLGLWVGFDPAAPGMAFVEDHAWIPAFGIRYAMGIDGIALAMIVLTGLLMPLAVLCSWRAITHRVRAFHVALLALQTGMIGVFATTDLFMFYVFWEVMLLPMALLIGIWGGPRRVYAAVKFVLYTMSGSLLMFVAILYAWFVAKDANGGVATFDIATLQAILPVHLTYAAQLWLFAAFTLSFAIKVPMFPLHTWLPDAHVEAPTAGSVILAGVLLKMGTYGFLRFAIPFFPQAAAAAAPLLLAIAAVGIVYGSLMSLVQTDIKKLVAYSSVAHLGFVMLGLFSGDVAGAQGGVLQMVNHGISTGALFLLVGVVYERAHTRGTKDFGGLSMAMPLYAVAFLIVTLSSIGLPGTNGFVGEFLVLMGTFQRYPVIAAVGGLGVVLGAVYMLTLYRNVFFGPAKPSQEKMPDANGLEIAALVPLIALIFVLGVAPSYILNLTEAPVTKVVNVLVNPLPERAAVPAPEERAVPARAGVGSDR